MEALNTLDRLGVRARYDVATCRTKLGSWSMQHVMTHV